LINAQILKSSAEKYRHVVDIMTYDDLLRRLKTIRDQFDRRAQQ
jgi:hypothetical protein